MVRKEAAMFLRMSTGFGYAQIGDYTAFLVLPLQGTNRFAGVHFVYRIPQRVVNIGSGHPYKLIAPRGSQTNGRKGCV